MNKRASVPVEVAATILALAEARVKLMNEVLPMYEKWMRRGVANDPSTVSNVNRWREELRQSQAVLDWLNQATGKQPSRGID